MASGRQGVGASWRHGVRRRGVGASGRKASGRKASGLQGVRAQCVSATGRQCVSASGRQASGRQGVRASAVCDSRERALHKRSARRRPGRTTEPDRRRHGRRGRRPLSARPKLGEPVAAGRGPVEEVAREPLAAGDSDDCDW